MSSDSEDSDRAPRRIIKTAYDVQRVKLEKLMKNPDKPVVIPQRPKEKKNAFVPDFVRNVMGSSAGAGSGEFHVYRHLRRKEYSRQKAIAEMSEKERLDMEFQEKLLNNQRMAEERTAKKRAKRLKKKANRKENSQNKKPKLEQNNDTDSGTPPLSSEDEKETNNESVVSATNEKNTEESGVEISGKVDSTTNEVRTTE